MYHIMVTVFEGWFIDCSDGSDETFCNESCQGLFHQGSINRQTDSRDWAIYFTSLSNRSFLLLFPALIKE